MISFLDFKAVNKLARSLRIDPQDVRKARTAYLKKALGADAAIAALPQETRASFVESVRFGSLSDTARFDSAIDGASKLVTHTSAGFAIETVILRAGTGRTALCVSSQVGCAAACSFCATGHMGIARDLTSEEILDQLIVANEALRPEDRRVRNIVFMGMGEPLHNEANLHSALTLLHDPQAFAHAPSRTLVSTVGVPDAWLRTAKQFPTVNYALSLHSAVEETRREIIPLAKRYSLGQLRETIVALNRIQSAKTPVMMEYLMLEGVNDSNVALKALIDWLTGLRVHVNLIPFNAIQQAPSLRSSSRAVIKQFAYDIKSHGFPTTIRYSLGQDIDAACGQLVIQENRVIAKRLATQQR